jgi:hypothetical protein
VLAKSELRFIFGELLNSRVDIELAGEPKLLESIVVNGPESLPVRLTPRGA